ncbi:MAG TPA: putative Ig domain-containing protein, partial [Acidimicrobiales bacterium]
WTTSPKISSGVTRVGVTSGAIGFTGTAVDPGNDENTLTFPGNTPGTVLGSFSAHPSESFSYSVTNKTIATFLTQCESAAGLSSVTDLGGLADFGVPATSITVTQNPSGVSSIPIGNSPIYTATADLPGNPALDITPEATFSSLNPGVATFGGGLQVFGASLNLVGPGTTMISASFGGVTSNSVSLTVLSALQIVTTSLPDGQVGVPYDQFVTASGGLAPYSWSQGSLPTGLDINPATGEITGTPTTTGDYADAFVDVGDSYTPGNDLASQYIPIIIDP